jgi:hypothetical protein
MYVVNIMFLLYMQTVRMAASRGLMGDGFSMMNNFVYGKPVIPLLRGESLTWSFGFCV